jgi:hypothetical protein
MNRSNLMKAVLCVGLGAFVLGRPAPAEAAAAPFENCFVNYGADQESCDIAAALHYCPGGCDGPSVCAHFENGKNNVLGCQGNDS